MTHATLTSSIGIEFNDFLYASIDDDRNGKLLSVFSALARLDIDPWLEAAKLARLPKEAATQRLAELIAALPDEASAHRQVRTIAARLIAFLPRQVDPVAPPERKSLGAGAMASRQPYASALLLLILIAFFGLLIRPPSKPSDSAHPPAASSISTVPPPSSSTRPDGAWLKR